MRWQIKDTDHPSISMSSKILVKIHAVLRKLCPIAPCALLPMCPIAHVPHPPRSPISICSNNQYTICPCAPLPMCHIAHVSKRCQVVKKMSSCQKDVKCQKVKHRLWRRFTKKINWHNEVHTYWCQFWRQIWRSPKLFKNTSYAHFEGFWWPSYVTSKIDVNMCEPHYVNLFFFCEPPP